MSLRFCNNYPSTIWTTIAFFSADCGGDGQPYEKVGWWPISPGACLEVFSGDLQDVGQFWYYHAEADDGASWDGEFGTDATNAAFDRCWDIGTTNDDRELGYRELDIGGSNDYTLTFIP